MTLRVFVQCLEWRPSVTSNRRDLPGFTLSSA